MLQIFIYLLNNFLLGKWFLNAPYSKKFILKTAAKLVQTLNKYLLITSVPAITLSYRDTAVTKPNEGPCSQGIYFPTDEWYIVTNTDTP